MWNFCSKLRLLYPLDGLKTKYFQTICSFRSCNDPIHEMYCFVRCSSNGRHLCFRWIFTFAMGSCLHSEWISHVYREYSLLPNGYWPTTTIYFCHTKVSGRRKEEEPASLNYYFFNHCYYTSNSTVMYINSNLVFYLFKCIPPSQSNWIRKTLKFI